MRHRAAAPGGPQSGADGGDWGWPTGSTPARARIGLLTGPVGVGKTTVAERVVELAQQRGLISGGLLTPASKDALGAKVGIWGLDLLSGERRILARMGQDLGGPVVGPYSFDPAALDWALQVLEGAVGACDLLIVDEIGKLELWRGIGLAPIIPRLATGEVHRALVLVREGLLPELQERLGTVEQTVFETNEGTRDGLHLLILDNLMAK